MINNEDIKVWRNVLMGEGELKGGVVLGASDVDVKRGALVMGASEVHWCGKVRDMSPKSFFLI